MQLQRKNTNVTMQWFARGRLWASREAERDDFQMRKHAAAAPPDRRADRPEGTERRGSDWRPGGTHKDPRDRFKKKNRPERAWSEKDPATQRDRDKPGFASSSAREPRRSSSDPRTSGGGWRDKPAGAPRSDRPWQDKPRGKPHGDRAWSNKPAGGAPPSDRPWQTKPTGPRAQRKPWNTPGPASSGAREPRPSSSAPRTSGGGWSNRPPNAAPGGERPWREKPAGEPPRGERPWREKPADGAPHRNRPWSNRPPGNAPRGGGPWQDKPRGKPQGDRPGISKPPAGGGGKRPWSSKPRDQHRNPSAPRGPQSGGTPVDGAPRTRRDDEPDRD